MIYEFKLNQARLKRKVLSSS